MRVKVPPFWIFEVESVAKFSAKEVSEAPLVFRTLPVICALLVKVPELDTFPVIPVPALVNIAEEVEFVTFPVIMPLLTVLFVLVTLAVIVELLIKSPLFVIDD